MCLPLHNQNSRRHSFPRSLSPGNGGTTGITVETLQCKKRTTLMEEAEEVKRESDGGWGKTGANRRIFMPPSQNHKIDQCTSCAADVARRDKDVRRHKKRKQTGRDTGTGRKGMLVSRICRDPAALCLDFLIFSLCCSGHYQPNMWLFYVWEWDSIWAIFVVHLGTAGTNPIDSTFKFNSLWIILNWCELQLALHRNGW